MGTTLKVTIMEFKIAKSKRADAVTQDTQETDYCKPRGKTAGLLLMQEWSGS
jgi:hypothetical protein